MSRIREVWVSNLELEMRNIRTLMEQYPYVAMDTEFPGVVARPIGNFKTSSDYHYQTMRCNVDLLKIIQVGLTLSDEAGNYPEDVTTWQFNFRFSVNEDMCAPDSIDLLEQSGIDFAQHDEAGILPNDFAELMITSGLVLTDEAKWVSFHSGYDFGYFLKLLTGDSLPTSEDEFFDLIHIWFPTIYDIKFMLRTFKGMKGGLQEIADDLGVVRVGQSHQAGSDSLLTMATFFKMRELYFEDRIDHDTYSGKLYGLGQTFTSAATANDPTRGGATMAEREDRQAGSSTPLPAPAIGSALPNSLPAGAQYGPMGANTPFIRTAIGVGGPR